MNAVGVGRTPLTERPLAPLLSGPRPLAAITARDLAASGPPPAVAKRARAGATRFEARARTTTGSGRRPAELGQMRPKSLCVQLEAPSTCTHVTRGGPSRGGPPWMMLGPSGLVPLHRWEQLTGLSSRRLLSWARRRFITPSHTVRHHRGGRRLHDFRDLVSLRVAADLIAQGIRLPAIRKAIDHLRALDHEKPLAEVELWVYEGRLYFTESETVRAGRRPKQILAGFLVPVPEIVAALRDRIQELDVRPIGKIERRRGALGSKPVIGGTRIPIDAIRRPAEDGLSPSEICKWYPDLELADIDAALAGAPPRRRFAHGR